MDRNEQVRRPKKELGPREIEDWRYMSRAALARVFGISSTAMYKRMRTSEELCPRNTDGTYDLTKVITWWKGEVAQREGAEADEITDSERMVIDFLVDGKLPEVTQ